VAGSITVYIAIVSGGLRRCCANQVTEWVTEYLLSDGKSVKSGNRNHRIPGSLRFGRGLRDVEVAGSNPVAPTLLILRPVNPQLHAPF
jgi:hypothetical protein